MFERGVCLILRLINLPVDYYDSFHYEAEIEHIHHYVIASHLQKLKIEPVVWSDHPFLVVLLLLLFFFCRRQFPASSTSKN